MARSSLTISGFTGAASQLGGIAVQLVEDRLKLLALELREAKIRFVQVLLQACMGVVFSMLGLLLMVLAGVYALAPEWRLYGLVVAAVISMIGGAAAFMVMSRHLGRKSSIFEQSLAELKKDAACFSTRN